MWPTVWKIKKRKRLWKTKRKLYQWLSRKLGAWKIIPKPVIFITQCNFVCQQCTIQCTLGLFSCLWSCHLLVCLTVLFGASWPSSTHLWECRLSGNICCFILLLCWFCYPNSWCVSVWCTCISTWNLGLWIYSKIWRSKAEESQATSVGSSQKRPKPCGWSEWESVCFRTKTSIDSIATVATTPKLLKYVQINDSRSIKG